MKFFVEKLLNFRIVIILSTFIIFIYGIYSIKNLPVDAIPDLSDTQVIIYSQWNGQVPSVIENQITYPLVSNMLGLPKVKSVRGYSFPNYSLVYVIFEDGTDIYWSRSRVLEKLASISNSLPSQAKIELGPDATGVGWVFQYALLSKTKSLDELWTLQNFYIKYVLLSVENVAEVASVGGFEKEYRVFIKPQNLYIYKTSLEEIVKSIKGTNEETGGKYIEINSREYLITLKGYVEDKDEIENTVIKEINGVPIKIKDIGQVKEVPALRMGTTDLNGLGNTVGGIVILRYGANPKSTIEKIKSKLSDIKKGLPQDIEIITTYDRSDLIDRAINHLWKVLIEESVIVIVVVGIFLYSIGLSVSIVIFLVLSLLLTFIVMKLSGTVSNIMSLGGIAIAIGTMVDTCIVLAESYSRKREEAKDLKTAIVEAMEDVGKPLFLALLIVGISFLPMLALKGQAGKLFGPLVITKTYAIFIAAILTITIFPVLLYYFGKGKILPEKENKLVNILIKAYTPLFHLSIKFRYFILAITILSIPLSLWLFKNIGREFMPDLKEGTIMYMPTTVPGISIQEAQRILTIQDKIIKSLPEVETVSGKVGRADTPTDPAPLSMIETIITLKPENQWREGMTYEKIISELDKKLQMPGVVNSWTMPIKGRIDMITTGIRTPLGIKIYGDNLSKLSKISIEIESALKSVKGIMSVYGERITGATYIKIIPDREKLALYGLRLEDLTDTFSILFANSQTSTFFKGRERYSITLSVPLDYKSDLENLTIPIKDKLIPLNAVAEIKKIESPMEIKSENGLLVSYVYITPKPDADIGKIVEESEKIIKEKVNLPNGYYYQWSGQWEYWQNAINDLKVIIPIVLILIVILVYISLSKMFETFLIIFTLPSSIFGGLVLMYLLDLKLSLASIAGFLALLGIAAEMGIIMIVYIVKALEEGKEIYDGAVKRIRPKAMTMITIVVGLLPAVFLKGTGSEVLSKIAIPMFGGVITSFITSLFLIPAIYTIFKKS